MTVLVNINQGGIFVTPGSLGGGMTHTTPIDQPIPIPIIHPPSPAGPTIIRDPISEPGRTFDPKLPNVGKGIQTGIAIACLILGIQCGPDQPFEYKPPRPPRPPIVETIREKGKQGEGGSGTKGDGKDDGKEKFEAGPIERDPKKRKLQ